MSKFLPLRTAWITPTAPRYAPDGNCLRITGLDPSTGLWIAAVLGHEGFRAAVAQHSAGTTLPRLGARDLARLAIPLPSVGARPSPESWKDAADARLDAQRDLAELVGEVQSLADEAGPELPGCQLPVWVPPERMPETWAPDQAALIAYQEELSRLGWLRLDRFLIVEPARLRTQIPPARVLHLVEADGELGFRLPDLLPVRPPLFRIYADPIRSNEILLSTLGTSPKVVFQRGPTSTVWVSDQWARLSCEPYPGALALALCTWQVAWQLQRATTGAVRQFVGRTELAEVRVPAIPLTTAHALHTRLVAVLERRRTAEQTLAELRAELNVLVLESLRGGE